MSLLHPEERSSPGPLICELIMAAKLSINQSIKIQPYDCETAIIINLFISVNLFVRK